MLSSYLCTTSAVISELSLFTVLAIAAYTDFKAQTVSWHPLPFLYPVLFLNMLINKSPALVAFDLLGTAIVFLIFYMNAKLMGGGGGDALFLPAIPFQHGLFFGLLIILAGCLANVCVYALQRICRHAKFEKHVSLPLVPGVFLAYTLFLIFYIWRSFL